VSENPKVQKALEQAVQFFEHRDRMNAVVHLGEDRWSPITDLVRDAYVELMGGPPREEARTCPGCGTIGICPPDHCSYGKRSG